jgi:hypothetical protein
LEELAMTMRYRIVVRGEIGELVANAFPELRIEAGHGQSVLYATVADSAALYGILDRLRDLAIDVVSLHETDGEQIVRTESPG